MRKTTEETPISSPTLGGGPVYIEYTNVGGVDFPSAYKCSEFENNPGAAKEVVLDYFYDLAFVATEMVEVPVRLVETKLLDEVAIHYNLANGYSCVRETPKDSMRVVSLSSLPLDEPNTSIDSRAPCIELSVDSGEKACRTIAGKITLGVVGAPDEEEFAQFLKAVMNSGLVTKGTTSQAKFLGTMLDSSLFGGKEELPNAINAEEPVQQPKDEKVTPEGVIFVMGLVAAFVALVVIVAWRIRSRRRRDKAAAVGQALDHAEKGPDSKTKEVNDDELGMTLSHSFDNPEDLPPIPLEFTNTYSFEMGDMQKLEMLGLHGGGVVTSAGVPPGAEAAGEVSDSDVDSWAQTDASLGSIELRLEPITAEV